MIYEYEDENGVVSEQSVEYDLSNCLTITQHTFNRLLKEKHASQLIALYSFYVYNTNCQQANQPRCTSNYIAKKLNWSARKVQTYKKILKEMKLLKA